MDVREELSNRKIPFQQLSLRHDAERSVIDAVARTVLLRSLRGYAVAILPALSRLDLGAAARALRVDRVAEATPSEVQWVLGDPQADGMSPFGSFHGLPTMIDTDLRSSDRIVFEGPAKHEGTSVKREDFEEFEHPILARFTRPIPHSGDSWFPEDRLP